MTAERRHDRRALVLGPWARGKLLLFDLGYFDFRLFRRLDEIRGYFVSRLKRSSNPVIVAQNRRWRGRSVAVVGQCIWDVVDRLQREELDVTVQVRSRHRVYAGRCSSEVRTFRVVGVRDEASGEYHLYITNIGVEALQPADIARAYAVRWEVELLFKELKSHYRLDQIEPKARRRRGHALRRSSLAGREPSAPSRLAQRGPPGIPSPGTTLERAHEPARNRPARRRHRRPRRPSLARPAAPRGPRPEPSSPSPASVRRAPCTCLSSPRKLSEFTSCSGLSDHR
ncbi:MAG: IS4 family transposase [Polyangiaceae bacterium]|nr:IS4 family transposase [Polyangiaceae bacterium]